MTRTLAPLPLVVGLLAMSSVATAQATSPLTATLLKIGSRAYNSAAKKPISAQDCDDKVDLTFRVDHLPGGTANPEFLEVWVGLTCNTDQRLSDTSGNKCTVVGSRKIDDTDSQIGAFTIPVMALCGKDGDKDGDPELFFLGVKSLNTAEVATVFTKVSVKVDTTAPSAPTKVHGGSGETEIPVAWSSTDEDVDHYVLVWDDAASSTPSTPGDAGSADDDAGAAVPSDCSSMILMAGDELGGDPSKLPSELSAKTLNSKRKSTTFSGGSLRSDLAAVGVIAVDLAGNSSPVSNIACLHVVPTVGFWDQYRANGGTTETGCACSIPGQRTALGAAWPVGLAFIALLLRARRRRA